MTNEPSVLIWTTVAYDFAVKTKNVLDSVAWERIRKDSLLSAESQSYGWWAAAAHAVQALVQRLELPDPPLIDRACLLRDLPALGASFNVLLLEDDKEPSNAIERWLGIVSSASYLPQVLSCLLRYVGIVGITWARYGRCLWRASRAPRALMIINHNSFQELGMMEDDSTRSEEARLRISDDLGSSSVRFVRALLRTYSRLTVSESESAWDRSFVLRNFQTRVTTPFLGRLPLGYSAVGRACFSQWSLEWLQSGSLPDGVFPHHGPGAVSEGLDPSEKGLARSLYDPRLWWVSETLRRAPMTYDREGWLYGVARLPDGSVWESSNSARAAAVPKDYRGPRIIASEPALRQYLQEAVKDYFYKRIRRTPLSGAIDFSRADRNALAALVGSKDRKIATLDLKDASDLVRVEHVTELFRDVPNVLNYLMALRTGRVSVGDEGSFDITTFATMGSSLTFPVETIVITCLLVAGLWDRVMGPRENINPMNVRKCVQRANILVYGDDTIVGTSHAKAAMSLLESAGLVCNRNKCCYHTFFRESCGTDAIRGIDVTVPRPRGLPGASECSLDGIVQIAETYARMGCLRTACTLIAIAEKSWHKTIPIVRDRRTGLPGVVSSSQLYGWASGSYRPQKWDKHLQRYTYVAWHTVMDVGVRDPGYRRYWDSLAKSVSPERNAASGLPDRECQGRIRPFTFDSGEQPAFLTGDDLVTFTRVKWSSIPNLRPSREERDTKNGVRDRAGHRPFGAPGSSAVVEP